MAREFKFYGGEQGNSAALAQVIAAGIGSANENARLRAEAVSRLAESFSRAGERGKDLKFEAAEREKERQFKAGEADKGRAAELDAQKRMFEHQRSLALQGLLGELGQTGIREQGLDAPALMELFEQGAAPPPAAAPPSQIPQGPIAGPAFNQPTAGIVGLGPGAGVMPVGFQAPQQGGRFSGIPRHPPPMTWEERKFRLTEEEKRAVAGTAMQLRRLQAQGDKNVVVEQDTTLQDALGLGELDDQELEAAVIAAYPSLAPKLSLSGDKEDRRALDAKIKFLQKKQKVAVPNGPGITGLEWSGANNDPAVIHAAMEEVFGQQYEIPMNAEDMQSSAHKKLLGRFPEYVNRFHPTAVQAEAGQVAPPGPPQPAVWTKGLIEQAGLNFDQLPPGLQSAALARQPIGAGPDGRIMFMPREDGTPPAANWQQELDALQSMQAFQGVLPAMMGTGAVIEQTPTEVKKGAQAVRSQGAKKEQAPPEKEPAGSKTGGGTTSGTRRSEGPSTPGQSALERYRQSKETPAERKTREARSGAPPRSMSLVGLPEQAALEAMNPNVLLELLQAMGAGGGR